MLWVSQSHWAPGEQIMGLDHRHRRRVQRPLSGGPCRAFASPSDCLRAAVRGVLQRQSQLTARQLDVLECLAEGKTTQEIGTALFLTERSVEDHIHDLHTALGTSDRGALVARWLALVYQAADTFSLTLPPLTP